VYSPWEAFCCIAVAMRSPIASRSHWLTEASTLRTRRPAALRVSIWVDRTILKLGFTFVRDQALHKPTA
jgi:hypothetical protein